MLRHIAPAAHEFALMYKAISHDIQITVMPEFLPDQSDPDEERFFWAYTIEIVNFGQSTEVACCFCGTACVRGFFNRGAPRGHHGITDVFDDCALSFQDAPRRLLEVCNQDR